MCSIAGAGPVEVIDYDQPGADERGPSAENDVEIQCFQNPRAPVVRAWSAFAQSGLSRTSRLRAKLGASPPAVFALERQERRLTAPALHARTFHGERGWPQTTSMSAGDKFATGRKSGFQAAAR